MRSEAESAGMPEEKELAPEKTPVWIVDDDVEHINSLLRALKYSAGEDFQFTHYQEGEQMTAEFLRLAEEKSAMPLAILMDYKLDDDVYNPKYHTGVEVIEELKRIAAEHEIPLPQIAAFSSEQSYADQLLAAGASTSVKKIDLMAVIKYLQEIKEGAKE